MSKKEEKPVGKILKSDEVVEPTLQDQIAELKAKVAAGEEAAMARVCKALGVSVDEVEKAETAKPKKPSHKINMFVPFEVNINGTRYKGPVTVSTEVAEVLNQAIGDKMTRQIREMTGKDYLLDGTSGGFAPRIVGEVGLQGEKIQ